MTGRERQAMIEAEAAAWIARLQNEPRSTETGQALRSWLAEDVRHAAAFERATALWDMIPDAVRALPAARERHPPRRRGLSAVAAAVAAALLAFLFLPRHPVYETGIGEQRVVTLDDRSQIALNTATSLDVDFGPNERRVLLRRGEALFDVAKDRSKPFVVEAGDERIWALGTRFLVRIDGGNVAVALLEGRVRVFGPSARPMKPIATLVPGQRLTVTPGAGAAFDEPSADALTAWRRGEIVLDDKSLIEAAEEFNRYNRAHLVVADPSIASLRVSGVFATNDVDKAAAALAELHHLRVSRDGADYKLEAR